ncbi:amino acid adenylation domain-containing protein [Hyphomicrobiales bacterium BP6-180914]|uniref:Amino acid adenylation domain-containing protein n=2 Tax=Lichenifustis flavocetrariae TaxID=2949735 RepID=A0AA41YZF0_9HYPH|nr:Pls/PosA family non-ribosomal peptide synthetase [Lichenifustis flavocetrariae]MCW6510121.1 amino acid adenylation domain-containing protein [Lichenifustis flavocetrariae]
MAGTISAVGKAPAVLIGPSRPDLLRDELLAEIFDATVAAHADKGAIRSGEVLLTYRQVDEAATAVARGLIKRGVGPGSVVGLWMPRGSELLIGQIAVAKTGAAWLPFDADAPVDRIAVCLSDAEARYILTNAGFAAKAGGHLPCPALVAADLVDPADATPVNARALGATPDHPAYMIYTSGSTGVPKGIVITGRNICHYLRAANTLYHISSEDLVFQGASVAFDLSMEEIWIPYLVGATLFVASAEMLGEVDRLPDLMNAEGITVLDTVPTLLAMLTRDVPSLRLIILGGEACPASLALRWWRPDRAIFNTYGPTESTVVATAAEVRPGEVVTIGRPIANYTCYVADEALHLCPPGVEGELLIGGPGIARGYLKRDALTAEKFIANPFGGDGHDPVLYRSGDAVALDPQGNLAFRGRIDDQVKIRGFRVELGEIEAKLSAQEVVAQATVVLRSDDGIDQLVAFVVPKDPAGLPLDPKLLRDALRQDLPPYMIPARFEIVENLPRLSSGKADRKALKAMPLTRQVSTEAQEEPRTATEAALLAAAQKVLPPQPVPFDADFFTDLGGHSLLAARFVSVVRESPKLAGLTLQDMYRLRTLRAIAAHLDHRNTVPSVPQRDLSFEPPPLRRRFLCGLAQAIALPVIISLMTFQWIGVFISYMLLSGSDATLLEEAVWLIAIYVVINAATVALAIGAKWLIIGRMKPGRYPLWGAYFFRWWLVQRFIGLTHPKWAQGSPTMRLFLRALGADIGSDAVIGDVDIGAPDLLSIGAGAAIGGKVKFNNARVEGNEFIVGPIAVGADAYIGTSCVLEEGCVVGEGAELLDLVAIQSGTRVGAGEVWDGSPGHKVGMVDRDSLPAQADAPRAIRILQGFLYVLCLLLIPPLGLLPIFPAFYVFDQLDAWLAVPDVDRTAYLASLPLLAWPTSFVLVLITVALIAAVRWVVLPRVREGVYSVHSWFYFRKWAMSLATEITLDTLSSLFATIYMRAWYRLMGAKIGKDAEISTNLSGRYDLVEIGEKCFIADEVVLGDEEIRRGWMTLKRVRTGPRVFIGNDAVVPIGADIPEGALIGIKSKPPQNAAMSPGDTWFGTPPIKLPVRQRFDGGGTLWTFEPPRWKKYMRGVFEAVHISLPTMLFIVFGTWSVEVIGPKVLDGAYGSALWLFVVIAMAISLAMTGVVIAVKWLTMGRYEPTTQPMWSFWAMRTEAVAVMYWGLAGKVLLDHLRGTPFLPWVLRLFGAKFGKGVYMDMTDITEFDCVTVGDFVSINALSALQTHLYEDRVMKVGRVTIGNGVTIGAGSTVLYDTHVGDNARLGPLTLVMKGESIPPNTEWLGAPAEPKPPEALSTGLQEAA